MERLANKMLLFRKPILVSFLAATITCMALSTLVRVNYDLVDYLPDGSPSTRALHVMERIFDEPVPNARIMVPNVTVPEALKYKARIAKVKGIAKVSWLDDMTDVCQPVEFIPSSVLDDWYKDGNALFTVVLDAQNLRETAAGIRQIIGEQGAMAGEAVNIANAQETTGSEIGKMMLFIIPIILAVLFLTTGSWFEPALFLAAIGVSIAMNSGTNVFLGEISFITQATSAILQLAVSMDYSIFLLHRFAEFRAGGMDVQAAMANAMVKSFPSILASGLTTVLGFAALALMRFRIGPDMGIVLAKGICFSLTSVMLLLPALTVSTYKLIDRTSHRPFLPSFAKFGKSASKLFAPVTAAVLLLIVPAFLAQNSNDFIYGASAMSSDEDSRTWREEKRIENLFGKFNAMVMLLPTGRPLEEKALTESLRELPWVSSITSYDTAVGKGIPQEFVPDQALSQLVSGGYQRIVLTLSTPQEGPQAFAAVESIRAAAKRFYGDEWYLLGNSASVYDMRETVLADNKLVSIGAIGGIGLVLLLTFRSFVTPLVLLLAIQSAIWINMSFPYFTGKSMAYIGFMIISSVQLGATVDYAILYANRYIENRASLPKRAAAAKTVSDTTASILTSASILAASGFVMGFVSTNGVVGEFGILIGRGAALSAGSVLLFLPALLIACDEPIRKTTLGHPSFYREGDNP